MKIRTQILLSLTMVAGLVSGIVSTATAGDMFVEAIKNGKFYIDERYRYEFVDQEGQPNNANASTLRNRVGFKSAPFYNFMFLVEIENVMNIGSERFNNTINGRTQYPVVADVESEEINQLFLQYSGIPNTSVKVGRQVIVIDNMRFVGHVGWRQNNQTFDAALIQNKSLPNTTLTYAYVDRVNRIFGNDSPVGNIETETHILHGATKLDGLGTLKGYGYLLDHETAFNRLSSATFGGSFSGKYNIIEDYALHYHAEYASQEEYGDNPNTYDTDYYHLALGVSKSGLKATIGYEVLGSDNGIGFATPLATGHIFNGFADQFLVTPGAGLEDLYVDVTYKVKGMPSDLSFLNGLLLKAQYHDFNSEVGSLNFGSEFDFYAKLPLPRGFYIEAKYAAYNAEAGNGLNAGRGGVDVEKFTLGMGWKY